jgi:hypothetical protein
MAAFLKDLREVQLIIQQKTGLFFPRYRKMKIKRNEKKKKITTHNSQITNNK